MKNVDELNEVKNTITSLTSKALILNYIKS